MKKKISKQIALIAADMPIIMRNTCEKHFMVGADVLQNTEYKEIEGKAILPDKPYIISMPVQVAINHKRAMKKLYKRYKGEGVKAYMDAIEKTKQTTN